MELQSERAGRRHRVSCQDLDIGTGRVDKQCHHCRNRRQFVRQLHELRPQLDRQDGHTREVATRPVEAADEAELNRVDRDREDDWN